MKRCVHCGIFFIAHQRNAGRSDLRCPFGCSQAHRRKCSTERSVKYYQTDVGKKKKAHINNRRNKHPKQSDTDTDVNKSEANAEDNPLNPHTVKYVRLVVSHIEGRKISVSQVLELIRKKMRQHSIGFRRKPDYIVAYLKKNPP